MALTDYVKDYLQFINDILPDYASGSADYLASICAETIEAGGIADDTKAHAIARWKSWDLFLRTGNLSDEAYALAKDNCARCAEDAAMYLLGDDDTPLGQGTVQTFEWTQDPYDEDFT